MFLLRYQLPALSPFLNRSLKSRENTKTALFCSQEHSVSGAHWHCAIMLQSCTSQAH